MATIPDRSQPPVLTNHPTQSATTIDGWPSALLGLPFLIAGVLIEAVAFDVTHAPRDVPPWVGGLIGGMFVFGGLSFLIHGLRGVVRRAAYVREVRQRPDQPWMYDFHWRQDGVTFSAFGTMLGRLMAALVWYAFLAPFFWVGLNANGGGAFLVFAALFGLLGLVFWFRWLQMLAELVRYGNSFLQYDTFPYALGGTMSAQLRTDRHFAVIQELVVTFRCVEEKYVTSGTGRNSRVVLCYELYKDAATFRRDQLTAFAAGVLPLQFRIPGDQPTTALASQPPIYWEIEARGTAPDADYEAYFLVPVYKIS
jgi:hypothetical protein